METKKRCTLELSSQVHRRWHRLRELTDAESLTEVFRRALSTYGALVKAADQGDQVILRSAAGIERRLLVP